MSAIDILKRKRPIATVISFGSNEEEPKSSSGRTISLSKEENDSLKNSGATPGAVECQVTGRWDGSELTIDSVEYENESAEAEKPIQETQDSSSKKPPIVRLATQQYPG